jgi:hypothetical protein
VSEVLGISDEAFKKAAGKTFSDLVEDWGNIAMNDLRESLQSKVKLTTSKGLEQSILAQPIAFDGKTLSVAITALPYADFLNQGVQGAGGEKGIYQERMSKFGNIYLYRTGITNWLNKAPQSPFKFKNKRPPLFENWANLANISPFIVQESVYRSGIKANHFIDEVVNGEFKKQFAEALSKVMGRAIEVDITLDFKK